MATPHQPCRICSRSQGAVTCDVREMMFGTREVFRYFQCAQCQCLQIATIPDDMAPYYPPTYYSFRDDPVQQFHNLLKRRVRSIRDTTALLNRGPLGALTSWIKTDAALRSLRSLSLTRAHRILDVGCGTGSLLYALRSAGFRHLLGVDRYLTAERTYPNGLTIRRWDLEDVPGTWDVVMFHHSFEHLPDPQAELAAAARLLRPGGTCLVRIPTVSSYAWEHYRTNWVQLDAPRHFFLHSRESLRRVAEAAGLTVRAIVDDSAAFQFWGSEQYQRDIPLCAKTSYAVNPRRSIFTRRTILRYHWQAARLNRQGRGDAIACYLMKA